MAFNPTHRPALTEARGVLGGHGEGGRLLQIIEEGGASRLGADIGTLGRPALVPAGSSIPHKGFKASTPCWRRLRGVSLSSKSFLVCFHTNCKPASYYIPVGNLGMHMQWKGAERRMDSMRVRSVQKLTAGTQSDPGPGMRQWCPKPADRSRM